MRRRFFSAALILAASLSVVAHSEAQTIRFQTSVGSFDMLLNPTNNAGLQRLVDNMVANVVAGVYHDVVVNRAPEDFVLQIGSFTTQSTNLSEVPFFGFDAVDGFDPVVVDENNDGQIDFNRSGLTNTRGTVSLALSNSPNSGSSSFFVNIGNNSFLDNQGFVPFATISDMSTVDRIMGAQKIDLSDDVSVRNPTTGEIVSQQGSLAYIDVPLDEDGELIIIESAAVVSTNNLPFTGPLRAAFNVDDPAPLTGSGVAEPNIPALPDLSTLGLDDIEGLGADLPAIEQPAFLEDEPTSGLGVPEPASLSLLLLAAAGVKRRR